MRLLALEQSATGVSAAVADGEERRELRAPREGGGEALLELVDRLLAGAGWRGEDLDALACGIGPGPYTGVRVVLGLAQGFARAWNRPLYGLTSTEVLGERVRAVAGSTLAVLVALEAGLGEVARLWSRPGVAARAEDHALLAAEELRAEGAAYPEAFAAAGSGLGPVRPPEWERCRLYLPGEEATAVDFLPLLTPERLAGTSPPEEVAPLYLRPAVRPKD